MKRVDFFDNLSFFIKEEDEDYGEIPARVFRNEDGDITEIQIQNPEYGEFMVIEKSGNVYCINIDEEEQKALTKK